jgi:hypothetical protein
MSVSAICSLARFLAQLLCRRRSGIGPSRPRSTRNSARGGVRASMKCVQNRADGYQLRCYVDPRENARVQRNDDPVAAHTQR